MTNQQMSLFSSTEIDWTAIKQITELFEAGVYFANELLKKESIVTFEIWAARLREEAKSLNDVATDHRLLWLWNTLRTDQVLSLRFCNLLAPNSQLLGTRTPIKVLNAGEWFVIGFNDGMVSYLLQHRSRSPLEEEIAVRTGEDLFMQQGKGNRLGCCDCMSEVFIRVKETYGLERESDIMRIDADRITIDDRKICVRVESLNQAYTVSSRRLEPNRRSHGGRTYNHVVFASTETRLRLEDIRLQVETGTWTVPPSQPNGT